MALIVLADDDRDVREFVTFLLEDKGHECLAFSNGDDALDAVRKEPDACLLVSDISMPAGDGRDLLESMRNGPPRLRNMPVLLISGLVPEPIVEDTLRDDLCRFLQKPFMPGQLYEIVDSFLAVAGK